MSRRGYWASATAALSLVAALGGGCERARESPESSQERASVEQQRLEREAILSQANARLDRIDHQISALEAEFAVLKATTVKQLAALERLRDERAKANLAVNAVREATTDTWSRISTGLEGVVANVEKAYQAALLELPVEPEPSGPVAPVESIEP